MPLSSPGYDKRLGMKIASGVHVRQQLRTAAVKVIKPRIGDRAWQALRRLDGDRATRTLVEAAAASDVPLRRPVRALLPDLDALLTRITSATR